VSRQFIAGKPKYGGMTPSRALLDVLALKDILGKAD
jgi:hypothetical protein